jgi:hypothetical protein
MELEKLLDSHMPDHLWTPVLVGHEDSIIQWYKECDLPTCHLLRLAKPTLQGSMAAWIFLPKLQ